MKALMYATCAYSAIITIIFSSYIYDDKVTMKSIKDEIIKSLDETGSLIKKEFTEKEERPAFFATLTSSVSLQSKDVVKFDNVKTNNGKHYDPNTGVFIATKPGLYEFNVKFHSKTVTELVIMKNDELIARGRTGLVDVTFYRKETETYNRNGNQQYKYYPQHENSVQPQLTLSESITAVIELSRDDRVYIRLTQSEGTVIGDSMSMFSGHKL